MANLDREGRGEQAVLVGDVMADVALRFALAAERSTILAHAGLRAGDSRSSPRIARATSTIRRAWSSSWRLQRRYGIVAAIDAWTPALS